MFLAGQEKYPDCYSTCLRGREENSDRSKYTPCQSVMLLVTEFLHLCNTMKTKKQTLFGNNSIYFVLETPVSAISVGPWSEMDETPVLEAKI
jgi:hypothetical protein